MNGKAFFDTNVLIYATFREDSRGGRAEKLLATGGIISVQVLNEFVSVARRTLQMPWPDLRLALRRIQVFCPDPVPLSIETHEEGLRIAEKYQYHIYDALIVASALNARCGVLYSEDFQDGQEIDGRIMIRNPFVTSP